MCSGLAMVVVERTEVKSSQRDAQLRRQTSRSLSASF